MKIINLLAFWLTLCILALPNLAHVIYISWHVPWVSVSLDPTLQQSSVLFICITMTDNINISKASNVSIRRAAGDFAPLRFGPVVWAVVVVLCN
jgi:hypothetical protein